MVKSFSPRPLWEEEARSNIHSPPPAPHLKPPAGILGLSEGSRAGRYQPRELKSSFCLKRPSKTSDRPLYQQIINYTAQLEIQECTMREGGNEGQGEGRVNKMKDLKCKVNKVETLPAIDQTPAVV